MSTISTLQHVVQASGRVCVCPVGNLLKITLHAASCAQQPYLHLGH